MGLELSSLERSIVALAQAIAVTDDEAWLAGREEMYREVVRAGLIQTFEIAYELSWKFIRRWLMAVEGDVAVGGLSRKALFRLAGERGLIESVEGWWEHHRARNLSSHVYDQDVAEEVATAARAFLADAEALLARLRLLDD